MVSTFATAASTCDTGSCSTKFETITVSQTSYKIISVQNLELKFDMFIWVFLRLYKLIFETFEDDVFII